jgi:hypothetical protein
MRNILFIVGAFLISFVGAYAADTPIDLFAFDRIDSIRVAKVGGLSDKEGNFHGYSILTGWKRFVPPGRCKFGPLLLLKIQQEVKQRKESTDIVVLTPFCVFQPAVAVHLDTDKGERDFLICFKCDYLYIYDKEDRECGMNLDSGLAAILRHEYARLF